MIRIGVDFGGTKIEAAAVDEAGAFLSRLRVPTPRVYPRAIAAVADLVARLESEAGVFGASIGIGMPGSISPLTGLLRNANSQWLAGHPFHEDLERALDRPVRLQNDANCFALSEAVGGAADGARVVFGAILGTGCGGGVAIEGRAFEGMNKIAGEWGHSPLPWPSARERGRHLCWCGRRDCLETWISGTAFSADFQRRTGRSLSGEEIAIAMRAGDRAARMVFARWLDRLARALAVVCDILDPDVIVLGGGMSNIEETYQALPRLIARRIFSDVFATPVVKAMHGDSSGVRGAAWLWPLPRTSASGG
ncbi:MAG: ROK family protein [Caulobacteraceae bacterium]